MKIDLNPRLKLIAANDAKIAYAAYQEGILYFDQTAIYTKQEDKVITHQTFTEPILNAWLKDNAVYYQTEQQTIKYEAYAQHINSYLVEEAAAAVTLEELEAIPFQTISTSFTLVSAGYKNAGPIVASYTPIDLAGITLTFSKYSKAYSGTQYANLYIDGVLYTALDYLTITEENKNKVLRFEAKAGTGSVSTDNAYVAISKVEFKDEALVYAGTTTYASSKYKITADKDIFFSPKCSKIIVTPAVASQNNINYVNDVKFYVDNIDVTEQEVVFLKAGQEVIFTSTSGTVIARAVALYEPDGTKFAQINERVIEKNKWIKVSENLTTYYRPEFHAVTADGIVSVLYNNSNYVYTALRSFEGDILKFGRETNLSRRTTPNYVAKGDNYLYYANSNYLRCMNTKTLEITSFTVTYLYDSNYCAITDAIGGKMYAINNSSSRRIIIDVVNKTATNEANSFTTYGDTWIGQYGYWLYYYTTAKQLVKVNAETGEKVVLESNVEAPGKVITRDEITRDIYIFATTYNKRILMKEDKVETFTLPTEIGKVDLNYMHISNGILYYLKYATTSALEVQTITYDLSKQLLEVSEAETMVKRIYSPVCIGSAILASTETYCNSSHYRLMGSKSSSGAFTLKLLENVLIQDKALIDMDERIFAPSYNDFVLGETIYQEEEVSLVLKEHVYQLGLNELDLKEAVCASEATTLKALVTVYAKDKQELLAKEVVQTAENKTLPLALTVYAADNNSLVLKGHVYDKALNDLNMQEIIEYAYSTYYKILDLKETVYANDNHSLTLHERITVEAINKLLLTETIKAYAKGSKTLLIKEQIEPHKENGASCVYIIEVVTTEGIMLLETVVSDASYKTRLIGFNRRVIQKRTNKE